MVLWYNDSVDRLGVNGGRMRRFGIVFAFIACWSATVFAMQTQKQRIGEIRGGESIDRLHTKASISGGKPTYIVALSLSNTCTRILTPAGSDSYRSVYGLAADPDIRHYGYMVRDTADRLLLIENGKPVRDFGDGFVYFDKSVLNRAVFSADFSKWIMLACRQDWLTIVWTDKGMLGTVRAFAAFSDGQIIHASHDLSRLAWIAENDSKQTLTVDGKQAFIAKSFGDFEWSADASRWAVTARVDDGAALVIDGKTVAELPDVRRIAGSVLKSDFSDFLMTYCDADGVWKVRSRSFVKSLPKDWAIVSEFAASADLSDRLFIAKTKKGEWTVRWRDFDFGPYRELYKIRVGSGENILQTLGQHCGNGWSAENEPTAGSKLLSPDDAQLSSTTVVRLQLSVRMKACNAGALLFATIRTRQS